MFYCSKNSIIKAIDGKEHTVRKSTFRPTRKTHLLGLYDFPIDHVSVKVPFPSMWATHPARNSSDVCAVFTRDSQCKIWCDEAQSYFTIEEIKNRGYFIYDNRIMLIGTYNYADFNGWKEVEGEFIFESMDSRHGMMRVKTK